MKRKLLFLVIFLGLILLVAASVRLLSNRNPKQGELRVDSQPVATIFLDNKSIGKTPFREKVDVGEYTMKLTPESSTDQRVSWEGKVVVGPNLLTVVNATLNESEFTTSVDVVWLEKITSKQSELSVTTNPDGATILIDDATRGVSPLSISDIVPGEHALSITSTGFLSRTLRIRTTPGYRLIANFKLAISSIASQPEASLPETTSTGSTSLPATASGGLLLDPTKPYVIIKDTPTGFLRVRAEPSTGASESGRVNPGEKYSYSETENGWYQIKYDGKNSGWVSGQYAEKVE